MKLNWGCGPDTRDGWTNHDRDDYGSNDVGDILDGLPYPDDSVDMVVANHSLQMIRYAEMPKALGELWRVMKEGAVLRVLVPDFMRAIHAYENNEKSWFPIVNEAETSIGGKLCAYINWYSEANLLFTPAWLAELLNRNGFDPAIAAPGVTLLGAPEILELDSRPTESIVVEGRKRIDVEDDM